MKKKLVEKVSGKGELKKVIKKKSKKIVENVTANSEWEIQVEKASGKSE